MSTVPHVLDMLTLQFLITEDCNLHCAYCFEKNKNPRSMKASFIKEKIEEHFLKEDSFTQVSIDLFGGEPFLAFETVKDVVEWFHEREWNKKHRFVLSTNGTLLSPEIKAWLQKWSKCVFPCLSLDGTSEVHNMNRSMSYDLIAPHIDFFRDHWPEQPVKMTISKFTIPRLAESIMHIHKLGLPVEANILFENIWESKEEKNKFLNLYAEQLDLLVDFYANHPDLPRPRLIDKVLLSLLHPKSAPPEESLFCGAGRYMIAYDCGGESYPCHRFAPLSAGNKNIDDNCLKSIPNPREMEPCASCVLLQICPTCQGFNFEINCHPLKRTTFHCEFFKLEVLASAKLTYLDYQRKISDPSFSRYAQEDMFKVAGELAAVIKTQELLGDIEI